MAISKKGVFSISFSSSMQMLDSWKRKYERDKQFFTPTGKVDEKRRLQLRSTRLDFIKIDEKKAGSQSSKAFRNSQILIKSLTDKKMEL